jgi:hypothetical protein
MEAADAGPPPFSGMEIPGATIGCEGSTMSFTRTASMTSAGATAIVTFERSSSYSSSRSPAMSVGGFDGADRSFG